MSSDLDAEAVAASGQHEHNAGGQGDGAGEKSREELQVVPARGRRPQVDQKYEFSAPKYFDFSKEESDNDIAAAEHWFDTAETYDPSPHVSRAKWIAETMFMHTGSAKEEAPGPSSGLQRLLDMHAPPSSSQMEIDEHKEQNASQELNVRRISHIQPSTYASAMQLDHSKVSYETSKLQELFDMHLRTAPLTQPSCGPKEPSSRANLQRAHMHPASSDSVAPSAQLKASHGATFLQRSKSQNAVSVPLELPACSGKRLRKQTATEPSSAAKVARMVASPFISMAERVRKFQMKTPDRFRVAPVSHCAIQESVPVPEKTTLKLTRPVEPHLETSSRARPSKVKSAAELEEEMLAKMPKFKARPLNKKIFELKQRRKSAPGCASVTEPHEPHLATADRARPPTVKSTEEMEQEELAKLPKFKARPLNAKIFQSKGDLGIFRNRKRDVTTPQEFHFATDERLQQKPHLLIEEFSQLSLKSNPIKETVLHPTVPEPFHLETEERGFMKAVKFMTELSERERQEQEARIPKANPLPFTTDIPVVPPKPEPKECTKPEPFQLESLMRHEEELQRRAEELARLEREEAARVFRALPNLSNVPVFFPERSRKPLTEVHEFQFHVDLRAEERAEFDRKVAEKQNQYKRFREEYEACKRAEEERVIKAMRKEMVPVAKPMPLFARPFVPMRSTKEPTRPVSPRLRIKNRRDRRRTSITSLQQRRSSHMR